MRIKQTQRLAIGLLSVMLVAAGCGVTGPVAQPPTAGITAVPTQPAATAVPATAAPATAAPATPIPATAQPTAPLAATAQPSPTAGSTQPTAEPIAMLPASSIWVRTGDTIIAQGAQPRSLDLRALDFPPMMHLAIAAPDGSSIAYISPENRLVVLGMSGEVRTLPEGQDAHPVGFAFSPDSRSIAFTAIEGQDWRLQVLDIASGDVRTLQEGVTFAQAGDSLALVPRPLDWTPAGLFVDQLLWASDAPPQKLTLVNPADGSAEQLRDGTHIWAVPTSDGTKVALVTGELPIGSDAVPTAEIAVLDVATGSATVIVAKQPGFVRALRWSPDRSRLLYAQSANYEGQAISLRVMNGDGSNEQRVDFGVPGFDYFFRDLAWRDNETPLLLLARPNQQLELHELSIHSFDPTGLKQVGGFDGAQLEDWQERILYVPRGSA